VSDVPPYGSTPPPGGPGGYPPPPPSGGYPPPPPPGGYAPPPPPGGYAPPGGYQQPSYGAPSGTGAGSQWGTLAEWPQRALGLVIDYGIGLGLFIAGIILGAILSVASTSLFLVGYLLGGAADFAWHIWCAMQVGQTGASAGMRVAGLKCIGKDTGQPIGAGMGVVRALAHFVDSLICYIGWLFPLWDPMKQTIADKLLGTLVITAPKQPFSIGPPAGTATY